MQARRSWGCAGHRGTTIGSAEAAPDGIHLAYELQGLALSSSNMRHARLNSGGEIPGSSHASHAPSPKTKGVQAFWTRHHHVTVAAPSQLYRLSDRHLLKRSKSRLLRHTLWPGPPPRLEAATRRRHLFLQMRALTQAITPIQVRRRSQLPLDIHYPECMSSWEPYRGFHCTDAASDCAVADERG